MWGRQHIYIINFYLKWHRERWHMVYIVVFSDVLVYHVHIARVLCPFYIHYIYQPGISTITSITAHHHIPHPSAVYNPNNSSHSLHGTPFRPKPCAFICGRHQQHNNIRYWNGLDVASSGYAHYICIRNVISIECVLYTFAKQTWRIGVQAEHAFCVSLMHIDLKIRWTRRSHLVSSSMPHIMLRAS